MMFEFERLRAVIFDLDGTLLDTIDDLADAMNVALRAAGLAECSVEACRHFVGDGVEIFARRAMGDAADDESLRSRVIRDYLAAYAENWTCKTRPYDGIPELLDALCERGLPTAVLSNKPDDFTRKAVSHFLGRWSFAAVVGSRPGVPHKPDPTSALTLAEKLDISPEECLYVGDTNTDMQTANNAGMQPVGVLWGFRDEAELRKNGAAAVIAHPRELLAFLSR